MRTMRRRRGRRGREWGLGDIGEKQNEFLEGRIPGITSSAEIGKKTRETEIRIQMTMGERSRIQH